MKIVPRVLLLTKSLIVCVTVNKRLDTAMYKPVISEDFAERKQHKDIDPYQCFVTPNLYFKT